MKGWLVSLSVLLISQAYGFGETTVIYDGAVSSVRRTLPDARDLWLTLDDLRRASRFVLKPQGACLDELCVPIPRARERAFLRRESGKKWFNLSELARALHQPEVHDSGHAVWLYGPRPESARKRIRTLEAPDFTLPDWKGVRRSLSDFRGKKVLLITWASW